MCKALSKFNEKQIKFRSKLPSGRIESKLYQEVGKDLGMPAPIDTAGYMNRVIHNDNREYAGIHKETQRDYRDAMSALQIENGGGS